MRGKGELFDCEVLTLLTVFVRVVRSGVRAHNTARSERFKCGGDGRLGASARFIYIETRHPRRYN